VRVYVLGILACIACPPAAVLVIPTFILLAILQLICGIIQAGAVASSRRRLRERLAAELLERRRIEAATNRRSAFIRMMYSYPRPAAGPIMAPMRHLTHEQRASIIGRCLAYTLIAGLVILIFGLR
jgi:hypothetical protein